MPQLHINATVTDGSASVTLPGDVRDQIKPGDYFKLVGIVGVYEIASSALAGSDTEITLTAPYVGESGEYPALIHRDFTEEMGYPLIYAGDLDVPDLLRRWALKMDGEMAHAEQLVVVHEAKPDPHPQYETKSQLQIIIRDSLRTAAEAASGGRVTVLYDSHGNPNWMHVLPRFSYEDLGFATEFGTGTCTAFIVDGVEKSEIFIGQYLASGDHAQSIAGADPRTSITYDAALAACAAKGQGWHLMTAHEWAAVALWCMANGFEPRGNTNWGRAHDATHETAVREDGRAPGDATGTGRTMAGGGPSSWYHTNDHSGIADLVGNVWEWQHGLKFVNGRIVCLPDNDFAAPEASWTEQNVWVNNVSGTPQLANAAGTPAASNIATIWASLGAASGYTPSQLARRLLIEPAGIHPQGRFYINTSGARFPFRGGFWSSSSSAGLAALDANNSRLGSSAGLGFRPAFVG